MCGRGSPRIRRWFPPFRTSVSDVRIRLSRFPESGISPPATTAADIARQDTRPKCGRGRGICVGDNVIGIHIPSSGPLDTEECKKSLKRAKEFFGKYFPKYKYSYFRCHSWLLDKKLEEILKCGSNILKFQEMFEIVLSEPSDAILRYVFAWNTTRENLPFMHPVSTFAEKVKEICLAGDKFNEATGFIATCEGNET